MTRSLAERTETRFRRGNGSVQRTAEWGVAVALQSVDGTGSPAPTPRDSAAALTQRLNRLTQELSESRQRTEQLRAALEKQTHRGQQLIGERDQLKSLLAGRDAELQRLNRELGALTARVAPGPARSPAWLTAAWRLLEHLQPARKLLGRANPPAPHSRQPDVAVDEKRLVPWLKNGPPKHVYAVVIFGLSETEIRCVLEVVERYCAEHEAAPLLLTDNDSFQLFRNRRVLFEFLPPRLEQQRVAPELDWQLFTLRRLALIRRKWRPARVVPFGRQAAEVVRLWRDSPFEETPLPTAPRSQPGLASGPAQQGAAA